MGLNSSNAYGPTKNANSALDNLKTEKNAHRFAILILFLSVAGLVGLLIGLSPKLEAGAAMITVGVLWMLIAIGLGHSLSIYKIGFIHESGLYIVLGLFGGAMWLLFGPNDQTEYNFSPDMFFDVVLPPIIFAASYNLKRKQFINNFAPIMVLAIIGAIFNFLMLSMVATAFGGFNLTDAECMLFAATMSATDGIAVVALIDANAFPTIFGTLIGEGCINDAVAIILYSSIDSLSGTSSSFGFSAGDLGLMFLKVLETASISILIGVLIGLISALYFKLIRMQPTPKTELTIVFLFGYLSYSISDLTGQSGIIAVFFCGVCMSHYTFHSLTHESQEASQEGFEAIAYAGETFIYISLGFYTFSYTDSANWSMGFLFTMLTVLVVGRVAIVVICVGMVNVFRKREKMITMKDQMVFWWGGIVRGAICFALSLRKKTEHSPILVTTTFAIVIITTFLVGSLTETFLICIGMKDPDPTAESVVQRRKSTMMHQASRWKQALKYVDETYVKPIFGGRSRRLHELSIDHPEFQHHFHQHAVKQIQNTGNIWASVGPTITSAWMSPGGIGGSPGRNNLGGSPGRNLEQYQQAYDTVRTIGNAMPYQSNGPAYNAAVTHSLPQTLDDVDSNLFMQGYEDNSRDQYN